MVRHPINRHPLLYSAISFYIEVTGISRSGIGVQNLLAVFPCSIQVGQFRAVYDNQPYAAQGTRFERLDIRQGVADDFGLFWQSRNSGTVVRARAGGIAMAKVNEAVSVGNRECFCAVVADDRLTAPAVFNGVITATGH